MTLLTRSQTKAMDRKAGESLLAYEERLAAFIQEANDRAAAAAKERNRLEQEEEAKRQKEEQDRLRQEEADLQAPAEHRSRQRERLFTRETVIGDEAAHWVEVTSADGAPETEKGLSALAQVSHDLVATCALQQEEILHLQQTVDQMLARLQALEKQPAAVAAAGPSTLTTRVQVLEDDVSNIKRVQQDFRTSQQATNLQLETQVPGAEVGSEEDNGAHSWKEEDDSGHSRQAAGVNRVPGAEVGSEEDDGSHSWKEAAGVDIVGTSTAPYTQAQEEQVAAILRERREKELLKHAKLKAIAEEQAAKKKKLEEEMRRLVQEEEEKRRVVEEEAAAKEEVEEEPLEKRRKDARGESSGITAEDKWMEKKISEWVANLSLGEDEEALLYVPQEEREAFARELEVMEDPLDRQTTEDEKRSEWKLRLTREKKRRREEANRIAREVEKVQACRQEVQAQAETPAKLDKILGYLEVLSMAEELKERMPAWAKMKKDSKGQLVLVDVEVFRSRVGSLIDSGATRSYISRRALKKLRLGLKVQKLEDPIVSVLADNRAMRVKDYVEGVQVYFRLEKDGKVERVLHSLTLLVQDDLPFDIVLGMDWGEAVGATLHLREHECRLPSPSGKVKTARLFHVSGVDNSLAHCCLSVPAFTRLVRKVAYVRHVTEPKEDTPIDPAIAKLLEEFKDLTEPPIRVVSRPIQHRIEIEPSSGTPKGAVYRMSPRELEELRKQLDEFLEKGWIRPSSSPFGAPVLFVPKKEGELRMCIDYRGLNAITVKNVEPLPRIDDLLDRVQGCRYFSKIDLKFGYHQIEVHPDDQYKTAFWTRYGHYEFIGMPFGPTNAPTTFQRCMNDLFRPWLDRFVVVYLDDILVFSRTLQEHQGHLRQVLEKLREANFKINAKKFEWAKTQVLYLGHVLDGDDIKPEDSKIAAISDWPTPRTLTELRSFLGLANYYRKFVRNFLTIAASLRRLLIDKKEAIWQVTAERFGERAFGKQIEGLRLEYGHIKKKMDEMYRSLKQNITSIKRPAMGVCISSPPEAPVRGKSKVIGVGTPTSQDFEKLLKAYNSVKEGECIADLEVQALRERFEKAVARLIRQGRTLRSNLTKHMDEATNDKDQDNLPKRQDGLDDLTIRPSTPKRTSGRLATKAATLERAEFLEETKKYLKRLKKHGLQTLRDKEGLTFITCEQAINDIAELRTMIAFDGRQAQTKPARSILESEADEGRDEDRDTVELHDTQPVEAEDKEHIAEE
ncbi:hypothetical protein CBR_g40 [Chara braunii]|uniref:Reverse transcriptase domain-containing protein n=1 Tax=Chara braunii TaxID=69332 RepID=A0A388JLJ6_CHABU|nr:hypothetical protein CBR_g40 [Chara braunii]|eukprot:GBG58641.1 hypothetical protein CBR_g40 [Chara braunii]